MASPLGWAARLGSGAQGLGGGWACIRRHVPWSPGRLFLPYEMRGMKLSHGPLCHSCPQNMALTPHSLWSEPRPSLCHSVPRPDPKLPLWVLSLLQTVPSCARRRPRQQTSVWNPAGARAEGGQTTDHNILVVSAVGPEMGLGRWGCGLGTEPGTRHE